VDKKRVTFSYPPGRLIPEAFYFTLLYVIVHSGQSHHRQAPIPIILFGGAMGM
jgi:hypothetical protein